ncbi:hypothetical protein KKC97_04050, partial [bacterium]|nr:hypothetical protein [bacterium]
LKIFALPESEIRWGILWDIADFIYPFVSELEKAKQGVEYDRELLPIVHQFHIRRNEKQQAKEEIMTGAYGLRIYHTDTDTILFSTPDLNTENQKFAQIKLPDLPFYYEVYNDDHDEFYRKTMIELLTEPGNRLGYGSLVIAFAMFVLAMLYRYVLRATKPE